MSQRCVGLTGVLQVLSELKVRKMISKMLRFLQNSQNYVVKFQISIMNFETSRLRFSYRMFCLDAMFTKAYFSLHVLDILLELSSSKSTPIPAAQEDVFACASR